MKKITRQDELKKVWYAVRVRDEDGDSGWLDENGSRWYGSRGYHTYRMAAKIRDAWNSRPFAWGRATIARFEER